ncbi:ATP-binding protein [Streptomyces sp. NPDC007088]|uniref:ATP-binding protein n=1 Tax=Streptomyces sp. NPDC007088 TaxID=3364773 RepID=UPI0036B74371
MDQAETKAAPPVEEVAHWAADLDESRSELIAQARWFAAEALAAASPALPVATVGTVKLVVSELITNACKYAPGPCRLEVTVDAEAVVVRFADTSSALPQPQDACPERVGRHGLEIVRAVADSYRTRLVPGGKRTTVRLNLPPLV